MSTEILPVDRSLMKTSAETLASAFEDDPLLAFLMPDGAMRRRVLPHMMEANLRLTLPYEATWALRESGKVIGVIAAIPPGGYPYPLMRELLFNWRIFWNPNPWTPPLARFLRVLSYSNVWSKMHMKPPHWYVYIIGVHRDHHGRGLGRILLDCVVQRATAERKPIYLETQTEKNVPFYRHMGFEITETHRPQKDGPPTWGLMRRARAQP